ncbi:alanine racemase [Clostridium oryzae]|uniref:Alanine racemase n=1 Tax=Clostridium oryzae TaxID=1450648 RepID=A0A1V4IYH7_9CLOT|nr:alanine racemase [Clostridium oryzae]OPJ65101.1 alanine racemase [Clostridium oryzae]
MNSNNEKLRPVWAEVDLNAAAHNMREIRRASKSKELVAVVKANAYGHGAVQMASVFLKNGATRLAVAIISEAIELRQANITAPIMILGYTPLEYAEELARYEIGTAVYSYDYALELSKRAKNYGMNIKIHIALDTGMGRIGFLMDEKSVEDVYKISKLPNLVIESIFSHFSTSDEKDKTYSMEQFKRFNNFCDKLNKLGVDYGVRNIANSGAIIDMPDTHLDMCRAGIILYGYLPSNEVKQHELDIKPVMSVKAKIVNIKRVPAGESISYGRQYRTERESIIATLPIGYADGFTRLLFNKAKVIVKGRLAPVVGRICMDMCMIDVTDIPEVAAGDEVVIMGSQGENSITADTYADLLGTINYEVLCGVGMRIPRIYK